MSCACCLFFALGCQADKSISVCIATLTVVMSDISDIRVEWSGAGTLITTLTRSEVSDAYSINVSQQKLQWLVFSKMSATDKRHVRHLRNIRIFEEHNSNVELTESPDEYLNYRKSWEERIPRLLQEVSVLSVCLYSPKQVAVADIYSAEAPVIIDLFKSLSPNLQADEDVACEAGEVNGDILEFLPPHLQDSERVVKACVDCKPCAFKFASPRLQCNVEVFEAALHCKVDNVSQELTKVLKVICINDKQTQQFCENLCVAFQDRATALRLTSNACISWLVPKCYFGDVGFRIATLMHANRKWQDVREVLDEYEEERVKYIAGTAATASHNIDIKEMIDCVQKLINA